MELVISISAIIVSITSIVIGVFYNRKTFNYQKEHDKRMSEPHLDVYVMVDKTKFEISLLNNGYGPCAISKIIYKYGEKKYSKLITLTEKHYDNYINEIDKDSERYFMITNRTNLATGKLFSLYSTKFNKNFNEHKLIAFLKKVEIQITYKNIYEDEKCFNDVLVNKEAHGGIYDIIDMKSIN